LTVSSSSVSGARYECTLDYLSSLLVETHQREEGVAIFAKAIKGEERIGRNILFTIAEGSFDRETISFLI